MRRLPFVTPADVAAALEPARRHLERDGVVAYPTETVYGLGTLLAPDPLAALARLKGREPDKPFLLLIRTRAEAADLRWTAAAERLAAAFWPGPLTLVLADEGSAFHGQVRSAAGGVAVRATPHPAARALLEDLGAPLTSTSANLPGQAPARSGTEAAEILGQMEGGGDVLLLDGGTLPAPVPSTIVDCSGTGPPRLLRAGAVALDALRAVVENVHA